MNVLCRHQLWVFGIRFMVIQSGCSGSELVASGPGVGIFSVFRV